ncbi:MAG TPA: 30S ribosomal protein S16 [Firmicutes bacterium]|jgi:small subunit ribosomal protein S16|nr:30S ribosomal protein S16 [Bacillota bacterium]
MAVRIRLTRTGAAKQPHYRLVVADSRSPRDGRFIEIIGHYNPRVDPPELVVDAEKAAEWIKRGARPSETARALLAKAGVGGAGKAAQSDEVSEEEAESVRD